MQAVGLVKTLHNRLEERQDDAERFRSYYRGDHPLVFATPEFKAAMGGLFNGWSDNWCGVVVDSVAERLQVVGFRGADDRDSHAASWDIWRRSNADADLNPALVDALAVGRSSAIVWYPEADGEAPQITFESPTQVIVAYAPGSRRKRLAALKAWREDSNEFATLYTEDEVWKFQRRVNDRSWLPRQALEDDTWPLEHSFGAVPVVELRNMPDLLGNAYSEIAKVVPQQDAINLMWTHVMTASDAAALPQRVIIGAEIPKVPVVGGDGKVSMRPAGREEIEKFRQNRMGWIPSKDAKTGEWSTANMDGLLKTIEKLVLHVAAQSKTPPQYMLGNIANLNGEALTAAETGLVSKARERQVDFGDPLREVMRLAHLANDDPEAARAIAGGSVVWRNAEHRSLAELVDALTKQMAIGVPMVALWEQLPGVDQTEIARWLDLRGAMAATSSSSSDGGGDRVKSQADALGALIRAGVEPVVAARVVGLDVDFTGAVPVSLRLPTADATRLEG
jgi:hypothetical protein